MLIKTQLRLAQENANVSPKASSLPFIALKIFLKYIINLCFLRFVLIIFHSKYKITSSCLVGGNVIAIILFVIDNK